MICGIRKPAHIFLVWNLDWCNFNFSYTRLEWCQFIGVVAYSLIRNPTPWSCKLVEFFTFLSRHRKKLYLYCKELHSRSCILYYYYKYAILCYLDATFFLCLDKKNCQFATPYSCCPPINSISKDYGKTVTF